MYIFLLAEKYMEWNKRGSHRMSFIGIYRDGVLDTRNFSLESRKSRYKSAGIETFRDFSRLETIFFILYRRFSGEYVMDVMSKDIFFGVDILYGNFFDTFNHYKWKLHTAYKLS